MNPTLASFLDLLDLEPIEVNIFRGQSRSLGTKRVFGGQVLAQALVAAGRTVEEDRHAHSLHAYFILPGDVEAPIVYQVERLRDGGSFTTRRVTAVQHGRPIFNAAISFHRVEEGLEHFRGKLETADPEEVGTYPAEVMVNLLLKLGRGREAVEVARKYLTQSEGRQLTCPNLNELCQRFGAYEALAEAAKQHGDLVHFLAGRIASVPQAR